MKQPILLCSFGILILFSASANAATFEVTNLNDTGAGSFRQAIIDANNTPGHDIINVMITGTIDVIVAETPDINLFPQITDVVTILGNGITLQAISDGRFFQFSPGSSGSLIRDVVFRDGKGFLTGGAVFISGFDITFENCLFVDNLAGTLDPGGFGGAVRMNSVNTPSAHFINCTFSGNTSSGVGGAINITENSTVYLTGCTITNNTSDNEGGGIYNAGTLHMVSSIVAGNTSASGMGHDIYDTGSTIVTNVNNCVVDCAGDGCVPFTHTSDPELGPLQDNGEVTLTHLLLPTSPFVDDKIGTYVWEDLDICRTGPWPIHDMPIAPGQYQTRSSIASAGEVETATEIIFRAEGSIALVQGFHAKAGSSFYALIEECEAPSSLAERKSGVVEEVIIYDHTTTRILAKAETLKFLAYPNPFTQEVVIEYGLAAETDVELHLFNMAGMMSRVIQPSLLQSEGIYRLTLGRDQMQPGIWYLRLRAGSEVTTHKLVMLR